MLATRVSYRCAPQLSGEAIGLTPAVRGGASFRMASSAAPHSAQSNAEAPSSPQPLSSRGRKRKLSSPSAAAPSQLGVSASAMASNNHSAAAAGDNAASASGASGAGTAQHGGEQLPRGQPLKDFVENWEFRWDLQRQAYPWEWGSDSRLSDGPHNIIRYDQGPPKGWKPK